MIFGNKYAQYQRKNVALADSILQWYDDAMNEVEEEYMRKLEDFNTLKALAEQGDNRAQKHLGSRYYYGRGGVEQNYEEAIKWFKAAGWHEKLGMCYLYGHGVLQNFEEAVKCFLAADDKEMLGECYLHGLGVEPNINKTIELWESACENHSRNYNVMFKLAHLYGDGIEMDPDYEKALSWWHQLAENDSGEFGQEGAFAEAMYQLACYYYEGKGVKKSLKWALKYFQYAIDLFYNGQDKGKVFWVEYDRENYVIKPHSCKFEGDITISDEPDFIIHARKVLIKHGRKSVINKIKKAAQNGDPQAEEILKEFGLNITLPEADEEEKAPEEIVIIDEPKSTPLVEVLVGEKVYHKTYGEGVICKVDGYVISVDFETVGEKRFVNPDAFIDGFLTKTTV